MAQQVEIGDGAYLTFLFTGELLQNAEELIRTVCSQVRSSVDILKRQLFPFEGCHDRFFFISFALYACVQVCSRNPASLHVDDVCVAKLFGGGLHNCTIVRGMVIKGDAVGSINRMEKAKPYMAVFASAIDAYANQTKGTVLIHSAEQLENYAKTDEAKLKLGQAKADDLGFIDSVLLKKSVVLRWKKVQIPIHNFRCLNYISWWKSGNGKSDESIRCVNGD
ncbi:hypothetical protein REPUB_Repub06bG0028700 [Reevesia pubescens]